MKINDLSSHNELNLEKNSFIFMNAHPYCQDREPWKKGLKTLSNMPTQSLVKAQ